MDNALEMQRLTIPTSVGFILRPGSPLVCWRTGTIFWPWLIFRVRGNSGSDELRDSHHAQLLRVVG